MDIIEKMFLLLIDGLGGLINKLGYSEKLQNEKLSIKARKNMVMNHLTFSNIFFWREIINIKIFLNI